MFSGDRVVAKDFFFMKEEFKFMGDWFRFVDLGFELKVPVVVVIRKEGVPVLLEGLLLTDFYVLRLLNKLMKFPGEL